MKISQKVFMPIVLVVTSIFIFACSKQKVEVIEQSVVIE
jgi:hypothetical protein